MTGPLCGSASFGLYLGQPVTTAGAARALVARQLGLDDADLDRRLAVPGEPTVQGLSRAEALRLRALLHATGWPASIRPDADRPDSDLSLQPAIWADSVRLAHRLVPLLGQDAATLHAGLLRPGGLVLAADDPRRPALTDQALRRLRGLIPVTSDPQTALHDIFPTRPLSPTDRAAVLRRLRPFGTAASRTTGALAEGLTPALCARAMARLDPGMVIAVNRAFQRFELHLIGVTGWVSAELADFLTLRTGKPRARFEVISPAEPVVLDTALTHAVARQFCADYAAIGLFTRMHLRGLPQNIDNPIR